MLNLVQTDVILTVVSACDGLTVISAGALRTVARAVLSEDPIVLARVGGLVTQSHILICGRQEDHQC